jgi:hypothetical protein
VPPERAPRLGTTEDQPVQPEKTGPQRQPVGRENPEKSPPQKISRWGALRTGPPASRRSR